MSTTVAMRGGCRRHEREEMDAWPDTDVLVGLSRLDSAPLGTMRVHLNGHRPLPLEQSVKLPAYMQTAKLLEANRFAIVGRTHGPVLTTAFFKALFLYARHRQVDYIVITARRPVDRMYERLLYRDVDPEAGFIPIKHVGNVPHRVLFFPVKRAEEVWKAAGHPLYRYGFETDRPDIDVAQDTAIAEKEMLA